MKPWIYRDEVASHEIVDLTLNDDTFLTEESDDGKLPLPRYFQDLYNKHRSLQKFDLEDVVYDKEIQNQFMA